MFFLRVPHTFPKVTCGALVSHSIEILFWSLYERRMRISGHLLVETTPDAVLDEVWVVDPAICIEVGFAL